MSPIYRTRSFIDLDGPKISVSLGIGMSGEKVRRTCMAAISMSGGTIPYALTMERPIVELLAQLQAHPILRYLTLDGVTTLVRLITHLKRDILQPQPINESNPTNAPTVLPQPIARFLGEALSIPVEVMDNCWTILRGYSWEMPTIPLMQEDYDLFKQWGWQYGLSE